VKILNGDFETDTVTGADNFNYMNPSSWTGPTVTNAAPGNVLIKYIAVPWAHATNANPGANNFLGIQMLGTYVMQTVTVPANTNFSITFDHSARQAIDQKVPKLEVFCNAATNNGTTTLFTTTTTTTTTTTLPP